MQASTRRFGRFSAGPAPSFAERRSWVHGVRRRLAERSRYALSFGTPSQSRAGSAWMWRQSGSPRIATWNWRQSSRIDESSSLSDRGWQLPGDLVGRLVGAQAAPDRVAQPAGLSELAVGDLAHQRRCDPVRIARLLARHIDERRGLAAQFLQLGLDFIELAVVEPRSHAADIMQAGRGRYSHQ